MKIGGSNKKLRACTFAACPRVLWIIDNGPEDSSYFSNFGNALFLYVCTLYIYVASQGIIDMGNLWEGGALHICALHISSDTLDAAVYKSIRKTAL